MILKQTEKSLKKGKAMDKSVCVAGNDALNSEQKDKLRKISEELASTPFSADGANIRRLHAIAKEISQLADLVGRCEKVDFAEVWPESLDPDTSRRMQLPLYLGMRPGDEKLVVDLATMPHLLIGGAPGMGKTNLLNSIICGLARLMPPEEFRFVLFDPKHVEFASYANFPHLAFPVVADSADFIGVLQELIREMERRLKLFAREGVRNIKEYNNRVSFKLFDDDEKLPDVFGCEDESLDETEEEQRVPHIAVVVDEFENIKEEYRREFEVCVARLASKGRAVGIHLVMATQCEDWQILTASFRDNFNCRIAFKTTDEAGSRLIVRSPDAAVLSGIGDMIVRQRDGSLIRAQSPILYAVEEGRITDELYKKYPNYPRLHAIPKTTIKRPMIDAFCSNTPFTQCYQNDEEMYGKALNVIRETKRISVSHLQRRLGIGLNHAFHLIDMLEGRGIIGPARVIGRKINWDKLGGNQDAVESN